MKILESEFDFKCQAKLHDIDIKTRSTDRIQ